jgi:Domain of unknown function (DUF4386)
MEPSIILDQTSRSITTSAETTNPASDGTLQKRARLAGLLYFLGALTAAYAFGYLPSKILVEGDAAATTNNMLAHEFAFRLGIVSKLVGAIISVFFMLALYRLFKHVNEQQAKLMAALVFVQIPIGFVLEAFEITSLMILKGQVWGTLALEQKQNMAMLFLEMNKYGTMALVLLWGMWLFPFGRLVYQSGFIPRILGIFLTINGIAYIIDSLTFLLFPDYKDTVRTYMFPLFFGEVAIILWLLIKGAKTPVVKPAT